MDEASLRGLLSQVADAAPAPPDIVQDSLRSGIRLRRRRRVTTAAACLGVAAVIGAVIPAMNGTGHHQQSPATHGHSTPPPTHHRKPAGHPSPATQQTLYIAGGTFAGRSGVSEAGTITPFSLSTDQEGSPIRVGQEAACLAATPDGKTVYTCSGEFSVTPIDTAAGKAEPQVKVGQTPTQVLITPDGKTAYVLSQDLVSGSARIAGPGIVTPVDTATNTPRAAIAVGNDPYTAVMSPDGSTMYVLSNESHIITPISTATNTAEPPIHISGTAMAMALTPNGRTLYVSNLSGVVISYSTATGQAGHPVNLGQSSGPQAIVFSKNGATAYVADSNSSYVTPIDTATDTAGTPIRVGKWPSAVQITPDGYIVYALNTGSSTVTAIDTTTNKGATVEAAGGPAFSATGTLRAVSPEQIVFAGSQGWLLCLGPDGQPGTGSLMPISDTTGIAGPVIPLAGSPRLMVLAG